MGHIKYSRDIDIKDVYSACLKYWYEKYLKKVVNLTLDAKHQRDEIWAIGGGCLLAGFKKFRTYAKYLSNSYFSVSRQLL